MPVNFAPFTLCMIVKNEHHIINRCLDSIKPLIHSWVIADTGSTDNTPALIQQTMQGIPGVLLHIPWKNFSNARNQVINVARQRYSGYAISIDADEIILYENRHFYRKLFHDSYLVKIQLNGMEYWRRQIFSLDKDWRFCGAVHEHLECSDSFTDAYLDDLIIVSKHDSARNKDNEKYLKDIELLLEMRKREPNNARTQFLLAQSYRDSGQLKNAICEYQRHLDMPANPAHLWYSNYQLGLLYEGSGYPVSKVITCYQSTFERRPTRAEPVVRLIRYFISTGDLKTASTLMNLIIDIPCPERDLYVVQDVYNLEIPQLEKYLHAHCHS